jgi:hypothetical protein
MRQMWAEVKVLVGGPRAVGERGRRGKITGLLRVRRYVVYQRPHNVFCSTRCWLVLCSAYDYLHCTRDSLCFDRALPSFSADVNTNCGPEFKFKTKKLEIWLLAGDCWFSRVIKERKDSL